MKRRRKKYGHKFESHVSSDGRVLRPIISKGRVLTPDEVAARCAELGLRAKATAG